MKKVKLSLEDLVYQPQKVPLYHDVRIDGQLHTDYEVGHVMLRCSNDPVYLNKVVPLQMKMQNSIRERTLELTEEAEKSGEDLSPEKLQEDITELYKDFEVKILSYAIEDWDEDLFGVPYSYEESVRIFSKNAHNYLFNQISRKHKERESFLPNVGTQLGNG